jgi:hypothetical protein
MATMNSQTESHHALWQESRQGSVVPQFEILRSGQMLITRSYKKSMAHQPRTIPVILPQRALVAR